MENFRKGDVVKLKSGGPVMTIFRILGEETGNLQIEMADKMIKMGGYENGDLVCEWFDKAVRKNEVFKESSIELVKN